MSSASKKSTLLSLEDKKTRHFKEPFKVTQEMIDTFPVNHKGLYSLKYRKNKEPKGTVVKDLQSKFAVCGRVTEVDGDEGFIFLRFAEKDHAVAVLKRFGEELNMKVVGDKWARNKGEYAKIVEVYVGNIPPTVTAADLEEMLADFAPFKLKLNHISNDPAKRFRSAFVKFPGSDKDRAARLVKAKDGKIWKGKKLYVGFAREGKKAQAYSREEGEEEKAIAAKSQDSSMVVKPLSRTSSMDSKALIGTIPKMLPSRREPVADSEAPRDQSNKPWWKKNTT